MKGTLYVQRTKSGKQIKKPEPIQVGDIILDRGHNAYAWIEASDLMAAEPLHHASTEIIRDGIFIRGLWMKPDGKTYVYQEWLFIPDGQEQSKSDVKGQ